MDKIGHGYNPLGQNQPSPYKTIFIFRIIKLKDKHERTPQYNQSFKIGCLKPGKTSADMPVYSHEIQLNANSYGHENPYISLSFSRPISYYEESINFHVYSLELHRFYRLYLTICPDFAWTASTDGRAGKVGIGKH